MTDPKLEQLLKGAVPFALPLRRSFRSVTVREGMLIRGPHGWGEFAPFDDYSNAAAAKWLASAVEAAFGEWPAPIREFVPVNAIIPATSSDDAAQLAREAIMESGCSTIKIKVGERDHTLADDEARVASVRDVMDTVLGRGIGKIRIDANGGWDVDRAKTALRRLSAYGLEYVEQPCATPDELRELRDHTDVAIAVDENLRRAQDPSALKVREFADIAIIKAAPLGGVAAGLALAQSVGLPVVVSGSLDTSVGLSSGLALAGALETLDYACGLGTGALLAADVTDETLTPIDGVLPVTQIAPDLPALLAARDALGDERASWWRGRLAAAWEAGAAQSCGHLVETA